ncbi:ATP-binding protein [Burkholderia cepacia]|uniref:ATP-binding protein n=1 Tax=Burkholderia cepacia TaxID=292 RepID=UPI000F590CD2|nr:ATP-binding protein [Burkholderia cepacia]UIY55732.1 ATP-binding protein [Burkholderia cepacia]
MIERKVLSGTRIPDKLLSSLANRDVALWMRGLSSDEAERGSLAAFMGLPWRLVVAEACDADLIAELEATDNSSEPMTRRRGFVQIIDTDPSRIELPERCLPVYLLNGRQSGTSGNDFASKLRRITMLEELRRSGVRELLVLSGDSAQVVPSELSELWEAGYRSYLTFISSASDSADQLAEWLDGINCDAAIGLIQIRASEAVRDLLTGYATTYPEHRRIIRVRDARGALRKVDITEAEEPERPISAHYSFIEEKDLAPLMPDELSEEDFIGFFRDPEVSWLPYAAGVPWMRHPDTRKKLESHLRRLDAVGAEEGCVAYISCESGAGGTTLARMLAWECASQGYPVLLAKPVTFAPEALPVVNFLTRVRSQSMAGEDEGDAQAADVSGELNPKRYEAPWVIVYDRLHWQDRDSELVRFRNELVKSGRPVCLLVVTGTVLGLSFLNSSIFKRIAELNHALDLASSQQLGRHLNRFLRLYGKERDEGQWGKFYQDHTVRYLEGVAAFWVSLSFWIQHQYDLSESIQEWVYKKFKEFSGERIIQDAILEIAAMSSERLPMPEGLLPAQAGKWPVSLLLEDNRSSFAALGLVKIATNGERYWGLVHDILGRFLINALFYDYQAREEFGLGGAEDAEHLRFLLLRRVSQKPELAERGYRPIGEEFATSIFKIDPAHGRGSFAVLWREVLDALGAMPKTLRDTSRIFRHHTAVSRRRIAKLDERFYGVTFDEKVKLLNQAIDDIKYAINFIDDTDGSESDLNLYNSLANAYLDLAEIELDHGATRERISALRKMADDATRRAYEASPTSSFVIETYIKNLLHTAREVPENAVENCIEALGILFSALASNEAVYRRSQLGHLAERAMDLLLQQTPALGEEVEPKSALDVLVKAWRALSKDHAYTAGTVLSDVPEDNRSRALDALAHPAGRGNLQVVRLTFDLVCVTYPYDFKRQLELVEQLQASNRHASPQLRLEYGILLFQNNRAVEGDREFRSLRKLWRDSEHFVYIPDRLRWLRGQGGISAQTVQAIVGSDNDTRPMARVRELSNVLVPFRPEEFGFRTPKPGLRFGCHVSFGHNGPFLRPVTAYSPKSN